VQQTAVPANLTSQPVYLTDLKSQRVWQPGLLGALWQLPNALPKVNTSEGHTVCRVYEGEALPDKRQDNIDQGDQQKQQVQCILLLCIAFTRSQRGYGKHPD